MHPRGRDGIVIATLVTVAVAVPAGLGHRYLATRTWVVEDPGQVIAAVAMATQVSVALAARGQLGWETIATTARSRTLVYELPPVAVAGLGSVVLIVTGVPVSPVALLLATAGMLALTTVVRRTGGTAWAAALPLGLTLPAIILGGRHRPWGWMLNTAVSPALLVVAGLAVAVVVLHSVLQPRLGASNGR